MQVAETRLQTGSEKVPENHGICGVRIQRKKEPPAKEGHGGATAQKGHGYHWRKRNAYIHTYIHPFIYLYVRMSACA